MKILFTSFIWFLAVTFFNSPITATGMNLVVGSYTGNASTRSITGLGFQPDLVIIKSEEGQAAWVKTSTMGYDNSSAMEGNSGFASNRIISLDADGFTIGTASEINNSGEVFHWVAMKAISSVLEFSTYTGNASDNRNISVGFQPDFVIIIPDGSKKIYHRSACSGSTDEAYSFDGGFAKSNRIQRFNSDGFQIGSHSDINQMNITYHTIAIKESSGIIENGCYTGNGDQNRSLSGLGFEPHYAMVRCINKEYVATQKMVTVPNENSLFFNSRAMETDQINYLEIDGINIGTQSEVNGGSEEYYYLAFHGVGALPVELLSFSAEPANEVVEVNWKTASEINNDYFIVERSIDSKDWEAIITVNGKGTTNQTSEYKTVDHHPLIGTSYYRLKQTDFNGEFSYSSIVAVNNEPVKSSKVHIYPNPASRELQITNPHYNNSEIIIRNLFGQIVRRKETTGSNEKILLDGLSSGTYAVEISRNGFPVQKEKILISGN